MRNIKPLVITVAILFACVGTGSAAVITLDFDDAGPGHGRVISNQYNTAAFGFVTIGATNLTGPDLSILYDSNIKILTGSSGRDTDLEFRTLAPMGNDGWRGGNLKGNENKQPVELGNLLIIAENAIDDDNDGIIDDPDDEGSRPAGELEFNFGIAISSVSFDLVDVEPYSGEPGWVHLYNGNTLLSSILFTALPGTDIAFGDNYANRFDPIDAGGDPFNRVVFEMGGSGAVDTLVYSQVPEPGTVALLGLGLIALFGITRRHRNRR